MSDYKRDSKGALKKNIINLKPGYESIRLSISKLKEDNAKLNQKVFDLNARVNLLEKLLNNQEKYDNY